MALVGSPIGKPWGRRLPVSVAGLYEDPLSLSFAPTGMNFAKNTGRLNNVDAPSAETVPGLTYTRTGAATAWRSDGTLVEFAPNVMRRTDAGVTIEGQRTNLLLNSMWAGGASVTSWGNSAAGSDSASTTLPTVRARDFVASASRPYMVETQAALAATTTHCLSVVVETISANIQAQQVLGHGGGLSGVTVTYPVCTANPSGGATGVIQPGRLHILLTTGASAGSPQIRVGLGVSSNATGTARLSLPQLEQASTASTPIITTGAAATVGADNLALVLSAGVTSYSAEYGDNLTATGPATPGPFDLATGRPWLNSALRRIIFL